MEKPCTICLVNQMCDKRCEELASYLRYHVGYQFSDDEDYLRLAYMLRNKEIKLIEDDTKLRLEWNWEDE